MITFTKIRWKNLLSTGNHFTEVQLDKASTTLVCGENGAGKTTMLDALTFVLYGKPFRNINLPQLVNTINNRDCVVEIEFSTNGNSYKVTRGIAPKVFSIERDGVVVDHTATVKDYQSILETQILKMNYKTFCQVVILGSTNYVPFMRLSAADRRTVVENLLDIDVFSKMNDILKTRILETKDRLREIESELKMVDMKIANKRNVIDMIQKKADEQIALYTKKLNEDKAALEALLEKKIALQSQIASLSDSVASMDKQRDSLSQMVSVRKNMESAMRKAKEEEGFYHDNEECPVCRSGLAHDFREDMIAKKKTRQSELQEGIDKIAGMITTANEGIKKTNTVLSEISDAKTSMGEVDSDIAAHKRYIKQLTDLIGTTEKDKSGVDDEKTALQELESGRDALEGDRKSLVESAHTMDVATILLKDSGIKRKIIRKYIPALNKIINKYLVTMDFFAQFTLTEDFTEVIKSRYRDEFSYDNFSEGEKLRIDLSLLLAWRDIARMKNSANTNLLILDEVFDSSLDAVGTEEVIKILQSMGGSNNIFIISHKSDQLLDKFGNVLVYKKVNNFSKLCSP